MCGIAGWYRRSGRPVPKNIIKAQCDAIVHRGPDDEGVFEDHDFGFGMRRLSIIDPQGGHQPIRSADGRYVLIFNGEIYNHLDLRRSLIARDYPYTTRSDSETIVAAFQLWGNAIWPMLEGMFAAAIWDIERRELTLARDALGIKPLYLTEQNDGIAFASELTALRVLPRHDFTIEDRAVHDVMSYGHIRRPRTIFQEVRLLDPGTYLTIGASGSVSQTCFWRPQHRIERSVSDADWIEQMQNMLLGTTRAHMLSDVPVGAFLSGGVDSSAVLAAIAKTQGRAVKAFTIGFPGSAIDETAAAAAIARHLGADHIVLPLDATMVRDHLPEILDCYDEPFADMAAIPTWFASRLAAQELKVVLCGEGGDELFAGYKRHRNAAAIERYRGPIGVLSPLALRIMNVAGGSSTRINNLQQNIRRASEFAQIPDGYQQFFAATQISERSVRKKLLSPSFSQRINDFESLDHLEQEYFAVSGVGGDSSLGKFLHADLTLNMPSAMLTRLDRATMAHSVEARVPFLSHKMVDWALTVPDHMKLRRGQGKRILREAITPWIPPSILTARKQGFQIPLADWLRGPLRDFAHSALIDRRDELASYVNLPALDDLWNQHQRGQANHARILYALMVVSHWFSGARNKSLEMVA